MTEVAEPEAVEAPPIEAMASLIINEPPHAPVPYYFATKSGWLQNVPTLFGTAHVNSQKWPGGLPDVAESFVFSDELVPRFIFDQALDFFRKVYALHKTEATTYICRDPQGQYTLFIPTQYVTAASVNHKVDPGEMGDRYPVGTIHSHCNFGAFHSGTDEHDMGKMPGLHATIGQVLSEEPEVAVAIAVGNARWNIQLADIVDDAATLDANGFATAPDHWLSFVHPDATAPWASKGVITKYKFPDQKPYVSAVGDSGAWGNWQKNEQKPTDIQEAELDEHESALMGAAIDLAELGYRLLYTITYDPQRASAWLANLDGQPSLPASLWED